MISNLDVSPPLTDPVVYACTGDCVPYVERAGVYCVCVCVCVCMHMYLLCVCVCVRICMHIMYICMHVHTHLYVYRISAIRRRGCYLFQHANLCGYYSRAATNGGRRLLNSA